MKAYRIIILFVLWFMAMFVFAWFNASAYKPGYADEPSFRVLDSDRLFFRNLRIAEYSALPHPTATLQILMHKDTDTTAGILPLLIINEATGEAYLRFRGDRSMAVCSGDSLHFSESVSVEESFQTGVLLLNMADKGSEITVYNGKQYVHTLGPGSSEIKAIQETLRDYFRLVRNGNNR